MTNANRLRRKSAFVPPGSKIRSRREVHAARYHSRAAAAEATIPKRARRRIGLTMLEQVQRRTIIRVLKAAGGNKVYAAHRLGIGRQTLYNKIEALGIET